MNVSLHDALHELAEEQPRYAAPADLARTAWSAGRRRRHWRQAIVVAVVLALVGVGALAVQAVRSSLPVAPASGGSSQVSGYPERIGPQLWVGDLPSRPGPIALLMQRVEHKEGWDDPVGWEAISETGHRWRLPRGREVYEFEPTLSPDGTELAYLASMHGPFVIRNLVTGHVTRFPDVTSNEEPINRPYFVEGQDTAFWSPDGRHVMMTGGRPDLMGTALILGVDGSIHQVLGQRFPVGWASNDISVWAVYTPKRSGTPPVRLQMMNLQGRVVRTLTLDLRVASDALARGDIVVSPDGSQVMVLRESNGSGSSVTRYSMADGDRLGRPDTFDDLGGVCPLAWAGHDPVVSVLNGDDNIDPVKVTPTGEQRFIEIAPRLGSSCEVWAADALTGTRHGSVWGLSNSWWSWWWKETLLITLAALALLTAAVLLARRASLRRART